MPRRPPSPPYLDLSTFRNYLRTRRHYSAEAIELRLLLHSMPAEASTAPQVLAWMQSTAQPSHLITYVARARTLYADARRAARSRAVMQFP